MSMDLTVFDAKTVANMSAIQLAPHVVAALGLAVSANPKAEPPTATFKTFQVMCGHVDPDLLVNGMAECLQHVKWFPVPKEVLDACDFIEQIINERANYRKPTSYAARGKVEAKAFDVAEFKRRLLPTTKAYIERRREQLRAERIVDVGASLEHNKTMLWRAEMHLEKFGGDYWQRSVDFYRERVAYYSARLTNDNGTAKPH